MSSYTFAYPFIRHLSVVHSALNYLTDAEFDAFIAFSYYSRHLPFEHALACMSDDERSIIMELFNFPF